MEILGIKSMEEWPASISEDIWLLDKDERQEMMDSILSRITELLSIGSLYLEFADPIKTGDGERVIHCWRYFLIIFHNSNRRNYAKEAILLLYQLQYLLSPQEAEQVKYSRFVNICGRTRRNISADLHMEHLNRKLKECIAATRASKTNQTIGWLAKALGTIAPLLHQFDTVNGVKHHHTRHTPASMQQDMVQVVNHINKINLD